MGIGSGSATTSRTRTTGRQAACRCMLTQMFRAGASRSGSRRVFTIHNLAYQGIFEPAGCPGSVCRWDLMHVDAMEYWGRISFLKSGIVFSASSRP